MINSQSSTKYCTTLSQSNSPKNFNNKLFKFVQIWIRALYTLFVWGKSIYLRTCGSSHITKKVEPANRKFAVSHLRQIRKSDKLIKSANLLICGTYLRTAHLLIPVVRFLVSGCLPKHHGSMDPWCQRGFDIGRVQSCVLRLPKYWPPSPPGECVLPRTKGGGVQTNSTVGEGGVGQYFGRRLTKDWPLTVLSL